MTTNDRTTARQLGGELVIPILGIAFTLYYFTTIWNSPWTAQVSAFLIGGILLVFCAIFVLRCFLWIGAGEGTLGMGNLFSVNDIRSGRIALLVATIGFCALIEPLGFTLTTFLFLAVAMGALAKGRRLGLIVGLSAITAFIGWAVFIWIFDTRFPRGWFENTMNAMLSNG